MAWGGLYLSTPTAASGKAPNLQNPASKQKPLDPYTALRELHICIRAIYICMYTYVYICICTHVYIYMCVCVCMCMYVCIYIYIYIYIYRYTYVCGSVFLYTQDPKNPQQKSPVPDLVIQASLQAP